MLGFALGNWIVPLILAVNHEGLAGIRQIPVEGHVFAHPPLWIQRDPGLAPSYKFFEFVGAIAGLAGFGVLGSYGSRRWDHLMVKKLKWLTEDELKAFHKTQYF
ncbi:MAG TPA: hypothetical protein VGI10_16585 [Polyangiaceae bacterium]|jgi:hypothetical protein